MARSSKRMASERGNNNLQQLQQLQLQFNPSGELKAVQATKSFSISECADDWDNYGFGSIVRIRLIDFQKYKDCIIRPGPYMNMLIGPNGTGKSTVVAAIALGLGASPLTIGRSKNPLEFIKYYRPSATIEIIIKCVRPGEEANGYPYIIFNRVIRRISIIESESDWTINGEKVTARQVQQKAEELGVQVDNLCQFLPQDRVSEFAQMTPEKMLIETMNAAASAETAKQFHELLGFKRDEKKLTDSLKKDQEELGNKQRTIAALQTIRVRAKEREERRKKLEIMKRKRPWLIYQEARKNFVDLKLIRDRLKAELGAAKIETDQELIGKIAEVEANLKTSARKLKQSAQIVRNAREEIQKIYAEASQIAAVISARKTEIRERRSYLQRNRERYEKDRKELRETEEEITKFEAQIVNNSTAATVEAIDRDLKEFDNELMEIDAKVSDLNIQKGEITARSGKLRESEVKTRTKIDEIRNLRNRRLDALARLNRNTFSAHEWLSTNRHRFRGNIIGPIALDLKVKDEKMAQAVESVISRSILVSFLCENVEDYDEFARVCEEKGWSTINSVLLVNYKGESTPMPQSPWNKKELKALGFDGVVSELLEGPHMIIWALHELSKIHLIPICLSERGSAAIDIVACEKVHSLMKFLSKNSFFEIKRSRYNDADVAIKSSQLKPGFILTQDSGISASNIDELQKKMDEIRGHLSREQEAMRTVLERLGTAEMTQVRLRQKMESAHELKKAALVMKADLRKKEIHRERLRKAVRETLSILQNESDENDLLNNLIEKIHERADLLRSLENLMGKFQEIVRTAGIQEMGHRLDTLRLKQLEHLRDQSEGQHANLQKQVEMAEAEVQRAKERAQDSLAVAEMDQITAVLKEAFAELTDSLAELNSQIVAEDALLAAGGTGDRFGQQDLDQLEMYEESIRTLEDKIRTTQSEITRFHTKFNEIGPLWRSAVDRMISSINEKFEAFFRKVSCQGQVSLGVPTNPTDYDQYSLTIKVKFRGKEEMQKLTGQRQSGGEKSVSTILYLLSLQELSRAPFRVVDEINQGMDVENERKIHALMVETATKAEGKRAQYFLITPKLLTGLEYNDKMHVLCIFNDYMDMDMDIITPAHMMFVYWRRFYKRPLIYSANLNSALVTSHPEIKTFRLCNEKGETVSGAELPAELADAVVLKEIYSGMVLLASMDKLLYDAQRQGRISFYMTSSGEEATHFGSAHALHPSDPIYAQYRETGVLLSRGFPLQQMLHQLYGNSRDFGKGRQMPVHYGSREWKIQTISSPLGTQLPQAVGYAYFLKKRNETNLPICYFGEGAASEGDFHAALNMAATLKTPLIFFCRNNQFAISTPDHEQYAGDGIAARGQGYGIPAIRVDGNDLWAVFSATKAARALALKQCTPVLIEAMTHRTGHHSTSDDSSVYRPAIDPVESEKSCPIARVRRHLQSRGILTDSENSSLIQSSRQKVMEALKTAEKFPKPAITNLFTDVYDQLTPELTRQQEELADHLKKYPDEYNLKEFEQEE